MKTVSGRNIRIICEDRRGFGGKFPILAFVTDKSGNEIGICYSKDLKDNEGSWWFPGEDLSME